MTELSDVDSSDEFIKKFEEEAMRLMGKSSSSLVNDILFQNQENIERSAENLALIKSPSWIKYAVGYKEAADILAKHLEGRTNDNLIYPVMFLYRHFIELFLKLLILKSCFIFNEEQPTNLFKTHELVSLWDKCKSLLLMMPNLSKGHKEELNQAGRVIGDFKEFEKNVEAFRFPSNTDDEIIFDRNTLISIEDIRNVMSKLYYVLDKDLFYLDL